MLTTIGERIKRIRALSNQTQHEFSKQLGIDRGHISKIETDKAVPSDSLVKLIGWEYNVNEKWVLFGDGERDKEFENKHIAINKRLLHSIIGTIETSLNKSGLYLTPEKKSEIICLIYDYYSIQGWDSENDKEGLQSMVSRYLTLVGSDHISADKKDKDETKSIIIEGNGNIGNLNINEKVGNGNRGNIQIGGNVTIRTKSGKIHYLPPPGTIGSDPFLKERIRTLFNKLGEEREKHYGKQAYPVMYNNFKRDFGIKNNQWTVIWEWVKDCAPVIIAYLEEKYDNTRQGRIEKAAKRAGHISPRSQLFKEEKELLSRLDLSIESMETKEMLFTCWGITSHKHLTHLQHWQFVMYLKSEVDKIYGDS